MALQNCNHAMVDAKELNSGIWMTEYEYLFAERIAIMS